VASQEPVLDRARLQPALEMRRKGPRGPLLLLDLGIPRNVAPDAGDFESVFLYAVDDLRELVDHNLGRRRREVPAVEGIVREEVDKFFEWMLSLQATPVVVALREEADRIRRETLDRFGRGLSDDERKLLERFSSGLMNKLMHHPTVAVRQCDPQTHEGLRGLDWARRLFGLDAEPSDNGDLRRSRRRKE
jgi:glutamyl-tRNA reductase